MGKNSSKVITPKPKVQDYKNKNPLHGRKTTWNTQIAAYIILTLVTFFSFYPSLKNDFVNWDDNLYVYENNFITDLKADNLKQIFSTQVALNYHPLTMLTIALDYKLAYDNNTKHLSAKPFHLTNVIIHILNTLLVFYFIFLLSGRKMIVAFIAALFFGVHPLRVESVTWISERKDVLYCFFFLISLIYYLKYIDTGKVKMYFLVLLFFLLSLLSKGMAITLPLILIITDYFLKRKFTKKLVLEKIPFFVLSIIFGIIALKIQSGEAVSEWKMFSLFQRFIIACYGTCMYIYKFFVPFNLSAFYPYPIQLNTAVISLPAYFYIFPVILLIAAVILYVKRGSTRTIIFGLLFYLFSVSIVLQFVSVGATIISERYTYIPFIGLFFMLGAFYNYLDEKSSMKGGNNLAMFKNLKITYASILVIFFVTCSYNTWERTKIWKNGKSLWSDVIEKFPGKVETAYLNRGNIFAREDVEKNPGCLDSALMDYNSLLKMNNKYPKAYASIGKVYLVKGNNDKAIENLSTAISQDSSDYKPYLDRALSYIKIKRYDLSLKDIEKVLTIYQATQPYALQAFNNLMLNNYDRAIELYDKLIENYPDYYNGYYYRGLAFLNQKKYEKSIQDFAYYIQVSPQNKEVYFYISKAYYETGNYAKATEFAMKGKEKGVKIDENYLLQLKVK